MKKLNYKGRGEHSVKELEAIIEHQIEEMYLYNSGQKKFTEKDMDDAYDKGIGEGIYRASHSK